MRLKEGILGTDGVADETVDSDFHHGRIVGGPEGPPYTSLRRITCRADPDPSDVGRTFRSASSRNQSKSGDDFFGFPASFRFQLQHVITRRQRREIESADAHVIPASVRVVAVTVKDIGFPARSSTSPLVAVITAAMVGNSKPHDARCGGTANPRSGRT